ncbi:glycoside hydrolase [Pseudovirgaria hyperparasitica]|uniref:Glycoside hydrolase n=1 Tax=Pseudovirgaria hyperparasitica TaxID=470096 RepID=A0A6A6WLK4_9PEZI|nr:glycoside hydrolase [Pseudovirgaria hyperparasitica]KAF2763100.1 glycoside hydrolase [Pseudovirgaria hyperparasitica]
MLPKIGVFAPLLAAIAFANPFGHSQVYVAPRQVWNNATKYEVKTPPLTTNWTYTIGTDPWQEYPRPQLERSQWKSLNGIWKYENASSPDAVNSPPTDLDNGSEVMIPSCLESGLSGIQSNTSFASWFLTNFDVPSDWSGEKVLLNFGAVDYEATVFIDGKQAGFHRGGYFAFTIDITPYLSNNGSFATRQNGAHELLVFVHDPTDTAIIPVGKQTTSPSHIFYTPCSGIWQQVWIESAPATWVSRFDVAAGMDGKVDVNVISIPEGSAEAVEVEVKDKGSGKVVGTGSGTSNTPFSFTVSSPNLWSPSTPTLYDITLKMGNDEISSYTGFRTIEKGEVNGVQRPLLNGKFEFLFATLDQGYWPDGIYTPPNREAMIFDLQTLKDLGFNAVRKHIKIETALFYQACDALGLMVIQDMPSLPPKGDSFLPNPDQQSEWERQLVLMINQQKSFPSIVTWVIYNEGWGQLYATTNPEFNLTSVIRTLDPTRLIDSTSGWRDHGAGDFHDNHHYAAPQCGTPFYSILSTPFDPSRIGFQGEFGGLGHNVSADHLWLVPQAVNSINQTYEISADLKTYNYRAHRLLDELREQTELFACSGAVYTQTTDVEGEVNGLLTYDRRVLRPDVEMWKKDIGALYDAAAGRA